MRTLRRVPRAGWLCALVALCTSVAWGLITPPMQVPDENAHFAYVQYLAETGELPRNVPNPTLSAEELRVLELLDFYSVTGRPDNRPIRTRAQDDALRRAEAEPGSRIGNGSALFASNNPPLYYLVQALPYWASPSQDLLDRLALMRIVSALMAAATVLAGFLFLRELLPGAPWAWTIGALAMAFQPLFGFFGGGVNNDIGLHLVTALLFLVLARGFRRGLTVPLGVALGAVVAAGFMTKLQFLGYVPAVGLALVVWLWRSRAAGELGRGLRALGGFALSAGVPVAAYLVALRTVWVRPVNDSIGSLSATPGGRPYELVDQLSYAWQLFLPRVGSMRPQFGEALPLEGLWFRGLIGRFGWLDYGLPEWAYTIAEGVIYVLLALAVVGLARFRHALGARWIEAVVHLGVGLGLLAVIAFAGYRARVDVGGQFEQARYVLPLLPLYAAVVAVAVRALGARWGPPAGVLFICLTAGHTVLSQLATLARYYG